MALGSRKHLSCLTWKTADVIPEVLGGKSSVREPKQVCFSGFVVCSPGLQNANLKHNV